MTEETIYTVEEAAKYLKITQRVLREYLRNERIKAFKIGRKWRIRHSAIIAFAEEQERAWKGPLV